MGADQQHTGVDAGTCADIHAGSDASRNRTTANAAAQAVAMIGLPEGRIILAQAVIALALAPKSNAVIEAIAAATADVRAGAAGTRDKARQE